MVFLSLKDNFLFSGIDGLYSFNTDFSLKGTAGL